MKERIARMAEGAVIALFLIFLVYCMVRSVELQKERKEEAETPGYEPTATIAIPTTSAFIAKEELMSLLRLNFNLDKHQMDAIERSYDNGTMYFERNTTNSERMVAYGKDSMLSGNLRFRYEYAIDFVLAESWTPINVHWDSSMEPALEPGRYEAKNDDRSYFVTVSYGDRASKDEKDLATFTVQETISGVVLREEKLMDYESAYVDDIGMNFQFVGKDNSHDLLTITPDGLALWNMTPMRIVASAIQESVM